ncbi:MAG: hypothetical protein FJW39_25865 [Acidobacteria bacterium]|nr:hypothetical protein [Acidobacteriota bacterium]
MLGRRLFLACLCPFLGADGQTADVIPRLRAHLKQTLSKLPDYTCQQTIVRTSREADSNQFKPVDTIQVQVGLINRKEQYTWPDSRQFDNRELRDLVGKGIVSTGNFADHVQHIFLTPETQFTPRGPETVDEISAMRIDYELPVEFSRYVLRIPPSEAEVGVKGSFWYDPATLDLVRLEVIATDIPPELRVSGLANDLRYSRQPIGQAMVLLPLRAKLVITDLDAKEEYHNSIAFAGCKQYQAESLIKFPGADEELTPPKLEGPARLSSVPSKMRLDVVLDHDIEPEKAALGEAVRAVLVKPAVHAGEVVAPEGSTVHGRLVRLEKEAVPFPHFVTGIEFHTIEISGNRLDLHATMQEAGPSSALIKQQKRLDPVFTKKRSARFDILVREKPRGEGVLHWDAKHPKIKRGLKMVWVTGEDASAPHQ